MRTGGTALVFIFVAALACLAADVPRPMSGTFIHDFAGIIPDDKKAEIQAKAQRLKDEYKTEIAVVIVNSLEGEESFDYSMRMARSWGIGSKDNETRGLLILVAVRDRKTAFRTSRHIEGELPDGVTGEISRRMSAYFKTGDFGGGLSCGRVEKRRPRGGLQPGADSAPGPRLRIRPLYRRRIERVRASRGPGAARKARGRALNEVLRACRTTATSLRAVRVVTIRLRAVTTPARPLVTTPAPATAAALISAAVAPIRVGDASRLEYSARLKGD